MSLLNEGRIGAKGCLMMQFPTNVNETLVRWGKGLIPENIIYNDPNDPSFGYCTEYHVTLKYGSIPDLTNKQIITTIGIAEPFYITLTGISKFESEKYDVIKFDVEKSDRLLEMRKVVDSYPNEDQFKTFSPHSTIAYVLPGTFNSFKTNLNISIPIYQFKYSGIDGSKRYFNLK
jgi:hypothetical protein